MNDQLLVVMTDEQRELFELGRAAATRQPAVHGTQLTGRIEWYTPPEYIEAARAVMGSIDTDPASSDFAQQIVMAKTYYTIRTNGLTKSWEGNVWMNPPYAAAFITPFVEKLVASLQDGSVKQAIMLTHCNSDTRWYHKAWAECSAMCQTRGRVRFYNAADGKANSPTHGHVFLYFGRRWKSFAKTFRQFGAISRPYHG